jgi:iron(III) transport system ATP-binding protein
MSAGMLQVERLTKVFETERGRVTAVEDVSFAIEGPRFFTMLGPSGCGKTTTLRMIAGLESATAGRVFRDGSDFLRLDAFRRNIGMVFQSYALFPHLTVFENAAYGLRLRGVAGATLEAQVQRTLELLGLAALAYRYPADLSGGQQQRVSIARALVYEPAMLLLDEPLANLDAKLRVAMRDEIRALQRRLGIMALYVTHDQEEAMAISDRLAVFDRGRLLQVGEPVEVYHRPASLFVADFIGRANFLPVMLGPIAEGRASAEASFGAVGVLRVTRVPAHEATRLPSPPAALAMVRPERLRLAADGPGLPGRVARVQFLGAHVRYAVETDHGLMTADTPSFVEGVGEGTPCRLGFEAAYAIAFVP